MGDRDRKREQVNRKAIVLAHFGTSFPSALSALDNIKRHVTEAFPAIETRICFTSNMIRNIWAGRANEPDYWYRQGVSEEVLRVQGFLGMVGSLHDRNFRTIIVQPTHIYHGEQYEDLKSYVTALRSIRTVKRVWKPFEQIVLSRPVLGTFGVTRAYRDDIEEVVGVLGADIERAREMDAAMLYVAHGNDFFSSGVFHELLQALRLSHPETPTYIGMVEGYPGIDHIVEELRWEGIGKVLLKPLMMTAGDHAHHDIDSDEPDSWRGRLEAEGCQVVSMMEGLGSCDAFAGLFIRRIRETAEDNEIDLYA